MPRADKAAVSIDGPLGQVGTEVSTLSADCEVGPVVADGVLVDAGDQTAIGAARVVVASGGGAVPQGVVCGTAPARRQAFAALLRSQAR